MRTAMDDLRAHLTNVGVDCSSLSTLATATERPIYRLSAAGGDDALKASDKMRSVSPRTGYWPVILGTPEDLRHYDLGEFPTDEHVRETLAFAESLHFPQWFTNHRQERLNEFLEDNEGEDPSRFFAPAGHWPRDVRPATSLHTSFELMGGRPHREIIFALVPTEHAWQVPAYLGFGNWNACPEAAVHCAAFKYWHERYGAMIVVITNDVVEAVVQRPPEAREDALALAQEQYEYCEDIVSQGTETISGLAASLLNARLWFFWWD